MIDERQWRAGRRPLIVTIGLLGILAVIWVLGVAPSAGPDEPAHLVRSGALVRGDVEGQVFLLPAWIGHPPHGCFALMEQQPASCATAIPRPTGEAPLVTRAWEYPVWGHLAPGLGTYLPATVGNHAARLFGALLPIGLIVAALALARRRGPAALGGAVLAITPMAWFSIIVVNPSGVVIAGGFALWVGLLSVDSSSGAGLDRLTRWTIAAGWAAAVLPRRDGMIWAALIVGICVAWGVIDLRLLARRLGVGPLVLVGVSTAATLAWAATSDTQSARSLFAMPLVLLLGEGARRLWLTDLLAGSRRRIAASCAGVVLAGIAAFGAMSIRAGGFDADLFQLIVGQTGVNLEEAIGLLGSLDTPLPRSALLLWGATLGVLAGAAFIRGDGRAVGLALLVVSVVVVASWVLEMNQGNTSGTYWQGRYSLPLLIGVPVVLGWRLRSASGSASDGDASPSVMLPVVGASLLVMSMAFAAGLRRWGVGTAGSMNPFSWDTYGTLLPPWLLLVAHVLVAAGLLGVAWVVAGPQSANVATLTTHDESDG